MGALKIPKIENLIRKKKQILKEYMMIVELCLCFDKLHFRGGEIGRQPMVTLP